MTLDELKIFIAQSEIVKIIDFVSSNRDKLKLFFSNIDVLTRETNICIEIIILLNRLNKQLKSDPEIQFLFTNLAFYFKKANKSAYVTTCINNLDNSILKNRLQAWHQYKTYTLKSSHINRFEDYLSKLTNAVSDEKEEYLDDILQDLHTYYSENSHNSTFQELFNNENLLSRYSLLRYYQKIRSSLEYRIELHEHVDKIYTPSIFSEQLFNDKFINYIRYHTDTKWNQILLGYEKFVVRSEVIKYGQANFDDSYKNLTKEDVVKLYCYFNMRKHYYSSLYLFERCSWLKKLIAQEGVQFKITRPIFLICW